MTGTPDELWFAEPSATPIDPEPVQPAEIAVERHAVLPDWVDGRLDAGAVSLIGGDADSIDILVGQFEHPDEAILRFSRHSGCATDVIGPWPTLSKIVMGRAGFESERLGASALLAAANSGALQDGPPCRRPALGASSLAPTRWHTTGSFARPGISTSSSHPRCPTRDASSAPSGRSPRRRSRISACPRKNARRR